MEVKLISQPGRGPSVGMWEVDGSLDVEYERMESSGCGLLLVFAHCFGGLKGQGWLMGWGVN